VNEPPTARFAAFAKVRTRPLLRSAYLLTGAGYAVLTGYPGLSPPVNAGQRTASAPAGSPLPEYFVGNWSASLRDMTIEADGTAWFSAYTYVTCGHEKLGQPCESGGSSGIERLEFQVAARDGGVYATVTRTNDVPEDPVGTIYRLVPGPDHIFSMEWIHAVGDARGRASGYRMCHNIQTMNRSSCGA
jgi:hypothetical protein